MSFVPASIPEFGIEDVALIFEEYQTSTGYFFVSGRKLCSCWKPQLRDDEESIGDPLEEDCEVSKPANISDCGAEPGSVIFDGKHNAIDPGSAFYSSAAQRAQYYNTIVSSINSSLAASLNSPSRRPYGSGSIFTTSLVLDELAELAAEYSEQLESDRPASSLESLRQNPRLVEALGRSSVMQVATSSNQELARQLSVSDSEAADLRLDILVEARTGFSPKPENSVNPFNPAKTSDTATAPFGVPDKAIASDQENVEKLLHRPALAISHLE